MNTDVGAEDRDAAEQMPENVEVAWELDRR